MGMFDNIHFEMECPSCGETVSGFQSKDGPCLLLTLYPGYVSNFYTRCDCGLWIEFDKKPSSYNEATGRPSTREEVEASGFVMFVKDKNPKT
jgi:hypothetical protein